jgi:hypothetical protein
MGGLQEALTPEWIALLRLAIAEARRFPDLGIVVNRMTRERGAETMPQLLRALSGEHLKTLQAEIGSHVSQRVAFFLSACRNGGIK